MLNRKLPTLFVAAILSLQATFLTENGWCRKHTGTLPASPPVVLHVAGVKVIVQMDAGKFSLPRARILNWIERSVVGVAAYFGAFPVNTLRIIVIDEPGHGMSFGESTPLEEAQIKMWLGTESTEADLKKEWTLVHEMVHLGFPFTADEANWATEGLATYVEPIIRAQMGEQTNEELWQGLKNGMPQGLPDSDAKGLMITHTWANTYWGGALFYLLADIEMRKETRYKKALPDALRAIDAAGGDIFEDEWDMPKTFTIGDKGTGTKVLMNMYKTMGLARGTANLDQLWKDLGVGMRDGHTYLDTTAPLAKVREAIERGKAVSRK